MFNSESLFDRENDSLGYDGFFLRVFGSLFLFFFGKQFV